MSMYQKVADWGYKKGLKDIRKKIQKAIKNKRLVFLSDNYVLYTTPDDNKKTCNFPQMAQLAVAVGGWEENMKTLGITNQDIVNILTEEYAKSKGGKK